MSTRYMVNLFPVVMSIQVCKGAWDVVLLSMIYHVCTSVYTMCAIVGVHVCGFGRECCNNYHIL